MTQGHHRGTTGAARPAAGRRADRPIGLRPADVTAPGLDGVVVAQTRLSSVDGARGELLIAGYPVDRLARQARYEEVLFLLWNDRLPTAAERHAFSAALVASRHLPPITETVLRAAAAAAVPPMDALRMAAATLSVTDPDPAAVSVPAQRERAIGLVARFPTLVAAYWRLRGGHEPVAPHPGLGHAANYLYMLTAAEPPPQAARALETYLNTVIDHGMNASTFTARVVTSTRADMVSAVVAAVGALKGPLHGGAPGPALEAVCEIRARAARSGRSIAQEADAWVRETVAAGGRIMGFGHRVYAVRDPRAALLAATAARVFEHSADRQLYRDARTTEEVVVRVLHELKPGRRVETNMEFYTAVLLHGLDLPGALFTPTFAVARVGGWTAHVLEQMALDRLIRPAVAYVGARGRRWAAVEARG